MPAWDAPEPNTNNLSNHTSRRRVGVTLLLPTIRKIHRSDEHSRGWNLACCCHCCRTNRRDQSRPCRRSRSRSHTPHEGVMRAAASREPSPENPMRSGRHAGRCAMDCDRCCHGRASRERHGRSCTDQLRPRGTGTGIEVEPGPSLVDETLIKWSDKPSAIELLGTQGRHRKLTKVLEINLHKKTANKRLSSVG